MRSMIVLDGLRDPAILDELRGTEVHRYHITLNDDTAEVVELDFEDDRVLEVCERLAVELLPRLYFAQIQDDRRMHVIFPRSLGFVVRGDENSERITQSIGHLFGIPGSQMKFLEMFETAHPDGALHA